MSWRSPNTRENWRECVKICGSCVSSCLSYERIASFMIRNEFFSTQTGLPEDFAQMWVLVYYSGSGHLGDVLRTVGYDGIPNLTCSGPAARYRGHGCWYFTDTFYNKVLGVVLCLWCLPLHRAGVGHFELDSNYSVTCDHGRWDLEIPGVLHRPLFLKWLHWLQSNIIYLHASRLQ